MRPVSVRLRAVVDLFSPVALGDLELANRVVMAPLTRLRAGASRRARTTWSSSTTRSAPASA